MWELRWVLVGLGALLIISVYLWGKGWLQNVVTQRVIARRWLAFRDKAFDGSEAVASPPEELPAEAEAEAEAAEPEAEAKPEGAESRPQRIITVRFIPKDRTLNTEKAILALRAAGLQHGRYGIFHRLGDGAGNDPWFSVASLTEPGSFDLTKPQATIPGMSFFMVLPNSGDPVARFDMMVQTARTLAHDLDAELHDDRGSSWSIQRERYLREEIIEYRHQHDRA
jgi:cell division protein ZipA